ncbi:MAG: hypothetical protein R2762_16230 [Bryobacteraceae bacterium]
MPITVLATQHWQNAYTGSNQGAGAACSLVDAGSYVGAIGTIKQNAMWRVDRQNPPVGKTNLQIQKNGVGNPSTIACCLVPDALATQIGNLHAPPGPFLDQANARFSELTRAIHSGLSQSVGSRRMQAAAQKGQVLMEVRVYEVQGNFSA